MNYATKQPEPTIESFYNASLAGLRAQGNGLRCLMRQEFCVELSALRSCNIGWNQRLVWVDGKALPVGLVLPVFSLKENYELDVIKLLGCFILCIPVHTYQNRAGQVMEIEQVKFAPQDSHLILPASSVEPYGSHLLIASSLADVLFLWASNQGLYAVTYFEGIDDNFAKLVSRYTAAVMVVDATDKSAVEQFQQLRLRVKHLRAYGIEAKSALISHKAQCEGLDSLGRTVLLEVMVSALHRESAASAAIRLIYERLAMLPLHMRQQKLRRLLSYLNKDEARSLYIQI